MLIYIYFPKMFKSLNLNKFELRNIIEKKRKNYKLQT